MADPAVNAVWMSQGGSPTGHIGLIGPGAAALESLSHLPRPAYVGDPNALLRPRTSGTAPYVKGLRNPLAQVLTARPPPLPAGGSGVSATPGLPDSSPGIMRLLESDDRRGLRPLASDLTMHLQAKHTIGALKANSAAAAALAAAHSGEPGLAGSSAAPDGSAAAAAASAGLGLGLGAGAPAERPSMRITDQIQHAQHVFEVSHGHLYGADGSLGIALKLKSYLGGESDPTDLGPVIHTGASSYPSSYTSSSSGAATSSLAAGSGAGEITARRQAAAGTGAAWAGTGVGTGTGAGAASEDYASANAAGVGLGVGVRMRDGVSAAVQRTAARFSAMSAMIAASGLSQNASPSVPGAGEAAAGAGFAAG